MNTTPTPFNRHGIFILDSEGQEESPGVLEIHGYWNKKNPYFSEIQTDINT